MYDQNQGKLEQVKSESELKPGMAIVLKQCQGCGNNHTVIVKSLDGEVRNFNCEHGMHSYIKVIPEDFCPNKRYFTTSHAIPEGRLFKIVDENPIADIIEFKKEKVRVK